MAMALPAAAAIGDTYTSLLEYKNLTTATGPYGLVSLEEIAADSVQVTVTLYDPEVGFLNTGGPHDPFLFNLTGNYQVTLEPNAVGQTFFNGGYDANTVTAPNFAATPFGNFTNKIGCCDSAGHEFNGASHMSPPPLIFTVKNLGGNLTFAGVDATFDTDGRLLTQGTGPRFLSNGGGWWFTADLVNSSGATFNVAARDAFRDVPSVPEPATWAMMLMGFGGMGALLRRNRRQARMAFA